MVRDGKHFDEDSQLNTMCVCVVPVRRIAITSIPECWMGVISQWGADEGDADGEKVRERKKAMDKTGVR